MQGPIVSLKDRTHKLDPSLVFLHCSSGLQNPTSPGARPQHPPLFLGHLHDPLHPTPTLQGVTPCNTEGVSQLPFPPFRGRRQEALELEEASPSYSCGSPVASTAAHWRSQIRLECSTHPVLIPTATPPCTEDLAQGRATGLPPHSDCLVCLPLEVTVISCTSFNLSSLVICKIRELIPLASHSCWEAQTSGTLKRLAGNKRSVVQDRGSLSDIEQPPRSGVGTTCTCKERQDPCRLRFSSLKQTFK